MENRDDPIGVLGSGNVGSSQKNGLTPSLSDDADPILLVVVVTVVVMLLVLLALIISFIVCRLRDRHKGKNREPELLTYCTTIDSLHKYWMVDLKGTQGRLSVEPPEPATLPVRGKADGSSLRESCPSPDDLQNTAVLSRASIPFEGKGKLLESCEASYPDDFDREVEVQVYHQSPTLCSHKNIDTVDSPVDTEHEFERWIHDIDIYSDAGSACHSVATHFTNFTEMSTDFTKSCEGIPFLDDEDFEFNCEDNLEATTRLCKSVDCLQTSYSFSSAPSRYDSERQKMNSWSDAENMSPLDSSHNSSNNSGTNSSDSYQIDGRKMLGMHESSAVISLSQMSISIKSCPNSPICKRDEENQIKRSYSKEYKGPFSFSETLLYCLPGVSLYDYSDLTSGGDTNSPATASSSGKLDKPGPESVKMESWEMRTPF